MRKISFILLLAAMKISFCTTYQIPCDLLCEKPDTVTKENYIKPYFLLYPRLNPVSAGAGLGKERNNETTMPYKQVPCLFEDQTRLVQQVVVFHRKNLREKVEPA